MKVCNHCKQELPIDTFAWRYKDKGVKQNTCKPCMRAQSKAWYNANKEHHIGRTRTRRRYNAEEIKKFIFSLNLSCVQCGEDHPAVLDFHHVDPTTKDGGVGRMMWEQTPERVKAEMDKCIVLCSNCHRKHHWNEKQM
jgi:hypothetical protein